MKRAALAVLLALPGCASTTAENVKGPREMVGRVEQPTCAFLCWLTVTITDQEGAKVDSAGAVSISKPLTTSTDVGGVSATLPGTGAK
jgi:hypothetical protein